MAITWANILEWETGKLEEIAQELLEASQGLRKAYEKGQDHLNALQSEGEAVTAMRATTISAGELKFFTIEHLMSALHVHGIDNCRVTLDAGWRPS